MTTEILNKQPDEITLVAITAVLMPNGELIRNGKSLGWTKPEEYDDKTIFRITSE